MTETIQTDGNMSVQDSSMSRDIGQLAGALAKAQGMIRGALKDSQNPYFKSSYADLASVWDACREALSTNDLAVIQTTEPDDKGIVVVTTLAHKSGEWMRGKLRVIPAKNDAQAVGSAITYGRRYALAAAVGVAQIDDDGNAATGKTTTPTIGTKPIDEKKVGEAYTTAIEICDSDDMENGPEQARELYNALTNDERIRLGELLKDQKSGRKSYASIFREYLTYKPEQVA